MANTNAPFGFWQYTGTGSSPTYEQTVASIASSNSSPIYYGDPVVQATGTTGLGTGYIQQAAAPVTYSITGGTLTNGIMALAGTFTTAIPVGATIVAYGFTSTAATVNGAWTVSASTTSAVSFPFSGAFTTGTGSIAVFAPVAGIFIGCRYLSVSQKKPVWGNYWPGADANGDVQAYIVTDPNAQFVVQTANSNTTATPVGLSNIGQNISFNLGTGTAANGLSGAYADQYTLTANYPSGTYGNQFLPFRILSLANYTPGQVSPLVSINGNDPTTAYNRIVVGFNNSMPRAFAGI
jgi:hypothetical protein